QMLLNLNRADQLQGRLKRFALTLIEFFGQDFSCLRHTAITDMRSIPCNEHYSFIFATPTKRAPYIFITLTHFYSFVSFLGANTSSIMPNSLASTARIQ